MAGMLAAVAAMVLLPLFGGLSGFDASALDAVEWLRGPIVALSFWAGLALIYRFGPDRSETKEFRMSVGAAVAVLIWLAASGVLSIYVSRFGSFNRTYGSMGAVVVLLLWFLLSAWAVLVGAEVDATRDASA